MKKLIMGLTLLSSLSSIAGPMISSDLKGNYQLIEAHDEEFASRGSCPNLLTVTVEEDKVTAFDSNDGFPLESFYSSQEGAEYKTGDIGPWRIKSTKFKKRSVKSIDSEPLTIIGYVRETKYIKLNQKNQLVVGEESTLIPVGVFGVDYDYKCVYERIEDDIGY